MTINVKAQLVPTNDKSKDVPDFRLYDGVADLGAAGREIGKADETPCLFDQA